MKANGLKRVGYKAANTNETSQKFLSLPDPFFGPLLVPENRPNATANLTQTFKGISKLWVKLCEPEFALQGGENGEITAVAPAIEIVHSSFLDWKQVGALSLIADLACNGAWFRGPSVPISQARLEGCSLYVNGKKHSDGHASKVLGSPMTVVNKLKAFLEKNGLDYISQGSLKPGDWISTGVCVDPPYHICSPGDDILVKFSGGIEPIQLKIEN